MDKLDASVSNDLATPPALAALNEFLFKKGLSAEEMLRLVALYDLVLGLDLLRLEPKDLVIRPKGQTLTEAEVDGRVAERIEARKAKDFAASDRIRDGLLAQGVAVNDGPEGSTWEWLPLAGENRQV